MNQNNIEDCLKVYNTIYPKPKFVYMSLPITTGPRFMQWYVETGQYLVKDSTEYTRLHRESVIHENLKLSRNYAERLFRRFENEFKCNAIINPAEFNPNFTQEEFMIFWDDFIKEYASVIVFMPGWAMSKGSLAEYIIAKNNNIPRWEYKNGEFYTLTLKDAIESISKAEEYMSSVGFNIHMQENILKLLKNESTEIRI